jgi:simple sugar transport system substrate-binding protein
LVVVNSRRTFARGLAFVAVLASALVVAACSDDSNGSDSASSTTESSASSGSGDLTIAMVGFEQQGAFWQTVKKGAEAAAERYGVKLNYSAPQQASDQGMIQLLNSAIASKPDGLAINYTGQAMKATTLKALDAGIPVTLYNNNRFEPQSGGKTEEAEILTLPFVGQNETRSGEVLGNAFAPHVTKSGKVLIVNPFPQAFVLTLRAEGVKTAMQAAGKSTDLLVAGADEGRNQQLVASYLQGHPDTAAIVGLGTPGANPAARAQAAKNLDIPVATFDIDSGAFDLIKSGKMTMALNQQPYLQGYFAVANLVLKAREGFNMVNVDTGTSIVTKDNIDEIAKLIEEGKS